MHRVSNNPDSDLFWVDTPNAWHQSLARIVDHRFTTFAELHRFALRAKKAAHLSLLLASLVLSSLAWQGKPVSVPAHAASICWILLFLSVVPIVNKAARKTYVRGLIATRPPKKEFIITAAASFVCIFLAIMLNVFARGAFGLWDVGTTDWQRAVMVGTYLVFE